MHYHTWSRTFPSEFLKTLSHFNQNLDDPRLATTSTSGRGFLTHVDGAGVKAELMRFGSHLALDMVNLCNDFKLM